MSNNSDYITQYLTSDSPEAFLASIADPFTRCPKCNEPFESDDIQRHIYQTHGKEAADEYHQKHYEAQSDIQHFGNTQGEGEDGLKNKPFEQRTGPESPVPARPAGMGDTRIREPQDKVEAVEKDFDSRDSLLTETNPEGYIIEPEVAIDETKPSEGATGLASEINPAISVGNGPTLEITPNPSQPLDNANLVKDTEGETTHIFPKIEGESKEQLQKKMSSGYTELPQFGGQEDNYHYNCFNCEYFQKAESSPTGYICKKFNYFDAPHGCCDGWELKPDLREYEQVEEGSLPSVTPKPGQSWQDYEGVGGEPSRQIEGETAGNDMMEEAPSEWDLPGLSPEDQENFYQWFEKEDVFAQLNSDPEVMARVDALVEKGISMDDAIVRTAFEFWEKTKPYQGGTITP